MVIFISLIIAGGFLLLGLILSYKIKPNSSGVSSFECGFETISNVRRPFRIKFFALCILFLIFDVEIRLFIPCLCRLIYDSAVFILSYIFIGLSILFCGLIYEVKAGILKW